jgi:hypothetical protein
MLSFPGKKWAVKDETNQFPFFTANLLPASILSLSQDADICRPSLSNQTQSPAVPFNAR